MRFVILNYHILKNAGHTVEEMLDLSFGERFSRFDSTDRDHTVSPTGLLDFVRANPSLQAVSSHQIRYPLPKARGILFFDICFVRNPIDRIRSMYDYFRQRPAEGDPVSDLANVSTPGDFVAAMLERFPLHIRNVQVNLIAAAGDSDDPTEADLELATARMIDACFPGVVDIFDESVVAGEYRLRPIFPVLDFMHEPVNVSGDNTNLRDHCDPKIWDDLIRMNALDFKLVERVRAEVLRRFKLVPDHAERLRARKNGARFPEPAMPFDATEIFDPDYYLAANPDVRAAKVDPLRHYLIHGAREGRKPHPLFQPDYYSAHGRNPHRLFDCASYIKEHPDAAGNPLAHYLKSKPSAASTKGFEGVHFEIDDVEATAAVWRDPEGRRQFTAPPEQRRFFESVPFDQLRAQMEPG